MAQVNIHEAKTHLSKLLDRVARGEEIVVAKAGKPVARLVPVEDRVELAKKRIGFLKGVFPPPPEDFDTFMQDEIIAMFEGDDEDPAVERA